MALLLYFGSHWALVIGTILLVIGLSAAAWVFKNIKYVVAAILVAVVGFMYQGAVMSGIKLQMAKDAAAQVEIYQGRINALNDLALKNAIQAKADADVINELESTASETPKNDGPCLDAAAAGRVRAIGSKPTQKPITNGPGRHTNLFSKRSR